MNGVFDTQLQELRVAASTATCFLTSGRTFELDLSLADVKQMDPAYGVGRLRVIAWASEVWQSTLLRGLLPRFERDVEAVQR